MPGITPSVISGWPNLAFSAAMMKSHIIGQLTAATQRVTRDGGNDWLADPGHAFPAREEVLHIHVDI